MPDEKLATLKAVARDLHWMARRYADGRQSYATSLHNENTRILLQLGVPLNPTGDGTIWARDAMGRGLDKLTDEEAAMGRQPDWWHDGPDAREVADAALARAEQAEAREAVLRAALADLIGAFTTHRTANHRGVEQGCVPCQESTAAMDRARAALAVTATSAAK